MQQSHFAFKIYPNPVSQSLLYIESTYDFGYNKNNMEIQISDVTGRKVKKLPFEDQIDISDLQKGIYFFSVELGEGLMHIEKIIVL
ncbi:MAG: T9SS type A sorting domain-containing protein [Lewinellaceae bacterium]|nr:T9SS type A sorting domain-containing protein [Saprospiraceae bacterium]MCB9339603.1 T9SS type A sorting domain-containing protein [Lewinellaceae bacterium]